jgi:pyrroline-5-carboxylate reductase
LDTQRIGFIGGGKMAQALAGGVLTAGLVSKDRLIASDVVAGAREHFERQLGCRATADNLEVVRSSDVIVLAVKPQTMGAILGEIAGAITDQHLVISIAAGVRLSTILSALGAARRVVRVMPNTPCLVGASASAFAIGGAATDEDARLVAELFGAVGVAYAVPETLLDAVTGLSGSGPAYVYVVIEALSDAGVQVGLPRDVALGLATQTVLGAALMVQKTGQHPAVLKEMVTSPGGTTIAGLAALERSAIRSGIIDAVVAGARRSRELGEPGPPTTHS